MALDNDVIDAGDIENIQEIVSEYIEDISRGYSELGFDVYDDILELIEAGGHGEEESEQEMK